MVELEEEHRYARKTVGQLVSSTENWSNGKVEALPVVTESLKKLSELYPRHTRARRNEWGRKLTIWQDMRGLHLLTVPSKNGRWLPTRTEEISIKKLSESGWGENDRRSNARASWGSRKTNITPMVDYGTSQKFWRRFVCQLQTLLNAESPNGTSSTLKSADHVARVTLPALWNAGNAEVRISAGRIEI